MGVCVGKEQVSNADRIYALEIKSPEELDKSLNELWAIYDTNSDGKLSTYECSKLTSDCMSASLIKMDQVLHPTTHLPHNSGILKLTPHRSMPPIFTACTCCISYVCCRLRLLLPVRLAPTCLCDLVL